MTRKYFGTDGIRGTANRGVMTAETALKLAMAAGRHFRRAEGTHRVVVGKDTRLSGYMIESALVSGFTAVGMDVFQFGPVPTPAVAMLTRSLRADLGVMISASHNPFQDNGLKLFGPDGNKLSDDVELKIERLMDQNMADLLAEPEKIGRAKRIDDSQARYIEHAKRTFPRARTLEGLRVVIDCANGAAYRVAPSVLWELGAEVIAINIAPNGANINLDCGSTSPAAMCAQVRESRADIGIALDGDADRVVIADERGRLIDGDQLLALIAERWQAAGTLTGGGVVGTVMSNFGLERHLSDKGLTLGRAAVGDRYVVEMMKQKGMNVGGEQSGHVVLSNFSTTGDGLVAGLQVLAAMADMGKRASDVCHRFEPVPQILTNVRVRNGVKLEEGDVGKAIEDGRARLGAKGRLVIRKSGTEPVIRVMGEGDDEKLVKAVVGSIAQIIEHAGA
ncbi:MAG TPA: phosphoglucosamine mutase [Micropepsaceae bacterium]|nr:phosphoglucosamine mutase [Micropepsaceae bacterium]